MSTIYGDSTRSFCLVSLKMRIPSIWGFFDLVYRFKCSSFPCINNALCVLPSKAFMLVIEREEGIQKMNARIVSRRSGI